MFCCHSSNEVETVVGKVIESREKLQKQETMHFSVIYVRKKSITIDLKASSTFSCKIMAKQELHSRQNVDSFCKDLSHCVCKQCRKARGNYIFLF